MSGTLLIVDDEEEIRKLLSRHFRQKQYDVFTASSVDEAVELLSHTAVQVVISDIMMPGKKGTELLPILNDQYPMTRAVMITGYVTLENALMCMRYGADTCVFKPLDDLSELEEAVERIIMWHIRWKEKLAELQSAKGRI